LVLFWHRGMVTCYLLLVIGAVLASGDDYLLPVTCYWLLVLFCRRLMVTDYFIERRQKIGIPLLQTSRTPPITNNQ